MDTLGPKPYQERAIRNFARTCNPSGKTVLEIGGSNLPAEFVFSETACARWIALDFLPEAVRQAVSRAQSEGTSGNAYVDHLSKYGISNLSDGGHWPTKTYSVFGNSVHDLVFAPENSVDFIFSIAAFEHIHDLGNAIAQMRRVLVPGGVLWAEFSPIWSSRDGHHFPIYLRHRTPSQIEKNEGILPPFGHLLMSKVECRDYLSSFYEPQQVEEAIHGIYDRDYINRLFYSDYLEAMVISGFSDFHITSFDRVEIEKSLRDSLFRKHPNKFGFEYNGMRIVAEKAIDASSN